LEAVEVLVQEAGADIKPMDNWAKTALDLARREAAKGWLWSNECKPWPRDLRN